MVSSPASAIRHEEFQSRAIALISMPRRLSSRTRKCGLLHPPGHGSSLHPLLRRCRANLRPRFLRRERHHCRPDHCLRTLAPAGDLRRLAFRGGRRARQPGREGGQRIRRNSTRTSLPVPSKRRAHGEPYCACLERYLARRGHGFGPYGAFRLSGAWRIGDRQTDCLSHSSARDAVANRSGGLVRAR